MHGVISLKAATSDEILTHLANKANAKKCVISNSIVTFFKTGGRRALADVNCFFKMTSVVALDGITSFLP